MKVKDLVDMLQGLNQEAEIYGVVSEAHGDNYTCIDDIEINDYESKKYGYELILGLDENIEINISEG
jgi:hypothetical protein